MEKISGKRLILGNGSNAGGDIVFEIDAGLGASNPVFQWSFSNSRYEIGKSIYFAVDADIQGNLIVRGNIEIQGTTTFINTTDLQIEDKNIDLNFGGSNASAAGAGFNVLGTSNAVLASTQYDSALASKFKLGAAGSESEVMTTGAVQTSTARKHGNGFVPAGAVYMWPKSTAPSYHLLCDGTAYLRTDYADLFAEIGTTFDTQVNPTTGAAYSAPAGTHFRVPDYRTLFLRGIGTNNLGVATTLNAWQDDATAKNGLTISSVTVTGTNTTSNVAGTTTASTTGNSGAHNHLGSGGGTAKVYTGSGGSPAFGSSGNGSFVDLASVGDHSHSIPSLTVSGTAAAQTWSQGSGSAVVGAGDTETRPQNKGINFIIKT